MTDQELEKIAKDYTNKKRRERYAAHPEREKATRIRTNIRFLIREGLLVPEIVNGKPAYVLKEGAMA